jgi:hypothetical protein
MSAYTRACDCPECECGHPLNADDECERCAAEVAEAHRLYGGGRHHHLAPAGPWRSREDMIRDDNREEA